MKELDKSGLEFVKTDATRRIARFTADEPAYSTKPPMSNRSHLTAENRTPRANKKEMWHHRPQQGPFDYEGSESDEEEDESQERIESYRSQPYGQQDDEIEYDRDHYFNNEHQTVVHHKKYKNW